MGSLSLSQSPSLHNPPKQVSEEAIREIIEDLPMSLTADTNASRSKEITEKEFSAVVHSMAKEKAPGHDGIPMEFF